MACHLQSSEVSVAYGLLNSLFCTRSMCAYYGKKVGYLLPASGRRLTLDLLESEVSSLAQQRQDPSSEYG